MIFVKASGLIVEYNPFHFGHLHHVKEAKKKANVDCIIAVMSGSFLQRGEPAIVDKFHRTKAAISSGVDIVIELPYAYAVQSSELFAEGAVKSLAQMGVNSICFGSESGNIEPFLKAYTVIEKNKPDYEYALQKQLNKGDSFPVASQKAYQAIDLTEIDLLQPNNILGFSYVNAIKHLNLPITPLTIQRIQSGYHDQEIDTHIASATSIRKEFMTNGFSNKMTSTLPVESLQQFKKYYQTAGEIHDWEKYFPLLRYQVLSQEPEQLSTIHGVDEGLEYRLKRTVKQAESIEHWLSLIKTKRYTQTRLQRCFVHILTNTTKQSIQQFIGLESLPYIRLLGMSKTGQSYLNSYKKNVEVPIYTGLNKFNKTALHLDEKAQEIYYTSLPVTLQQSLKKQEFKLPIMDE